MRTNDQNNWERRLRGESVTTIADEPDYGFYRVRTRDRKGFDVYAYYYTENGELRCRLNDKLLLRPDDTHDDERACELWTFACEGPITYKRYQAALKGEPWPDLNETVTLLNRAPDDDSFEGIQAAIDALESEAKRYIAKGAAKTKAEADAAADVADKLGKLWKKADVARDAEKRPHLEAERAVDNRWRPLLSAADIYKRLKAVVCTPFLQAEKAKKDKAEAEARRKAEEAARRAREAEAAAQREKEAALASGSIKSEVEADKATAAAESAARAAAAAKQAADDIAAQKVTVGVRGRGVHLRTETTVTITDRDVVLSVFKDRQEITDVLQSMAEKAVRAGIMVPGVTVDKGSKAA